MIEYNGFVAALAMKDEADARELGPNNFKYFSDKMNEARQSYKTLRESLTETNGCHDLYNAVPGLIERSADSCDKLKEGIDDQCTRII
jgi:hypothetical protein